MCPFLLVWSVLKHVHGIDSVTTGVIEFIIVKGQHYDTWGETDELPEFCSTFKTTRFTMICAGGDLTQTVWTRVTP